MKNYLSDDDKQFLLDLVDQPNSDFNDELGGWDNYSISEDGVLTVTWEDDQGENGANRVKTGRWQLTYLGGSERSKDEPEEPERDEHGFSKHNVGLIAGTIQAAARKNRSE